MGELNMKIRTIVFISVIICIFFIPSTLGRIDYSGSPNLDTETSITANNGVEIIRPKPGFLYLFDIIEIPIASQTSIIIGQITCVAEQIPVYPYTVRWEFIDWQYGTHTQLSDNVSAPYWRCTYTNFNFGNLEINAVFKNVGGSILSSDSITVNKFL